MDDPDITIEEYIWLEEEKARRRGQARTRERKAKSTLLMAIPDKHLARFHGIKDAKTLWAAIKTRFGGNAESKKMQKNVLKQHFEIFYVSNLEGLDKGLEQYIFDNEEKPGIDNLDIDDLYNNLKVYEADIKGTSRSSSNSQNVDFILAKSTSSTNELNAAYSVSTATCHISQAQEDVEKINQDDLEEIDLKWLSVLIVIEEGTMPEIVDQPGIQGTRVEMQGIQDTDEEIIVKGLQKRRMNKHWLSRMDLLDEALREKEDLKAKLKKFETSSKNLTKLLDSQISAKVKTGLGYDSQFNEKEVLDIKEEEVTETVFDNRSSDKENSLANNRFKKGEGYHVVPHPLTRNYMPPKPDLQFARLDDSIYKFKIIETVTSLTKDEIDAPETSTVCVEKPKQDRYSAPLIEDCETDSDDDSVFRPEPIPAKIDFVKAAIFTRFVRIPVSAAKPKAAISTSAAKPVNTIGPKQSVNFSRTRISVVKGNGVTAVKTSASYVWRTRVNAIDQVSKDNRWICTHVYYGHPQQDLKNKGIVDSGCSRHMTGNKAYLTDYQEINEGDFIAFGSSRDKITGKVTDDFSRFSWVFFLSAKDETSKVLKPLITAIENQINKKVKVIICDNGTKFKIRYLDEFCEKKGIKREFSNAKTQQIGVVERENRTLIEAASTMLADSLLPITF
uniref:Putative ribonuclease H-like domain-containing protein n=1 Tax=Tanacetum cinerariifolium TaxID=118510 RepID=A0A6L2NRL8_TANCI|nr:putative ribonuclease H-like domain-containing protein [Tanacetum cinerariifolium]